jgi:hypothetical protein
MVTKLSRGVCLGVAAGLLLIPDSTGALAQPVHGSRQPHVLDSAGHTGAQVRMRRRFWPRVRIPDPIARHMVVEALDSASLQFEAPRCRALLTEFSGRDGRPLATNLAALSVDAPTYLTMVMFIDGSRDQFCSDGVLAFTSPGSRVVRVCANRLTGLPRDRPDYITAALIHEILHTLGLGENPPSSKEITARVLASCRAEDLVR